MDALEKRFGLLLVLNVAVILALALAIWHRNVALYPAVVVGFPVLFVTNLALLWAMMRDRVTSPQMVDVAQQERGRSGRLVPAIAFTIAAVICIAAWIRSPSQETALQAVPAVMFLVLVGFFLYFKRLRRSRR
jgi:hypothetical protein